VKHDLKLYASEKLDVLVERVRKSRAKENPSDAIREEATATIRRKNEEIDMEWHWNTLADGTTELIDTPLTQVKPLGQAGYER
jgi:hypothetical protein